MIDPQHSTPHRTTPQAAIDYDRLMPRDFVFRAAGPAIGHHGVGRLQWRSGAPDGPTVVTGTDVAFFEDGHIRWLYVFVDPIGA